MPKHAKLGHQSYLESGGLQKSATNILQRIQEFLNNPEYTTDDMNYDGFERMNKDRKLAYLELRMEAEQYKAEKEAELVSIAQAIDEIDFADFADSFRGGPDSDGNEGVTE